jgi:predicted nucleotidyltransferase
MNSNLDCGIDHEELQNIVQIIKKCAKIEEAILFGSRAKGNYSDGSDIDIALKGNRVRLNDMLNLSIELDDLELPYKFDLVIYSRIKEQTLKDHIDRVGISLFLFT